MTLRSLFLILVAFPGLLLGLGGCSDDCDAHFVVYRESNQDDEEAVILNETRVRELPILHQMLEEAATTGYSTTTDCRMVEAAVEEWRKLEPSRPNYVVYRGSMFSLSAGVQ